MYFWGKKNDNTKHSEDMRITRSLYNLFISEAQIHNAPHRLGVLFGRKTCFLIGLVVWLRDLCACAVGECPAGVRFLCA